MNDLLVGLLSALVATNAPTAVSNVIRQKTGLAVPVASPSDPVERELQQLMADDDAALAEVDKWTQETQASANDKDSLRATTLRARIKERLDPLRKAYDQFLIAHPNHAKGRVAYGSFLNDLGEEAGAEEQWEKALAIDPKDPAIWNNLANHYGHNGDVKKSFEYYGKAIQLDTNEPVYLQNFATTVFLFRHDARDFFKLTEPQVFEKAMALYRQALALDPENFLLATELAQSYYAMKPPRTDTSEAAQKALEKVTLEAIAAWRTAYKLAPGDTERQGIFIHFARWQIDSGNLDEARKTLGVVTNAVFASNKRALLKKIDNRESTNAVPSVAPTPTK